MCSERHARMFMVALFRKVGNKCPLAGERLNKAGTVGHVPATALRMEARICFGRAHGQTCC